MTDVDLTVTSASTVPITTAANTNPVAMVPSLWYTHDCPVYVHTEDALRYDHLRTGCGRCAPGWFIHLRSGGEPSWRRGIWG